MGFGILLLMCGCEDLRLIAKRNEELAYGKDRTTYYVEYHFVRGSL